MADSFNKKEREKKKQKKRKEKAERKLKLKLEGNKTEEFMYVDQNGNLTTEKPDPSKKQEIKVEDIQIGVPKYDDADDLDGEKIGVVKFFNEEKGYGFIIETSTNDSFFVHANNLIDEIKDKDKVTFEVETSHKGLIAVNVKQQ